ncbi:MAG: aminotransferase class V-fold PLP-dependent enzyme [Planctomycetaceae bacterium]|jgi:isopenicillin-N epimerase|nr:aminotransferase class V-fold PLP-dependent enzyme [Planctomycetaceae bacterium]
MDRSDYTLDDGVTYLNNGSFGPSPRKVQEERKSWIDRLERQPMQFLTRDMEPALKDAMIPLANLVGTASTNITFVDNATFGMNVVAQTVRLSSDDEVLLTDHEYGAVMRVWRDKCKETGAKFVVQRLPDPLTSSDELVAEFLKGVTERTKLIVISHVTSATAAILPVKEICHAARRMKIPVCIDGPHAIGMIPVNLDEIDCDFYCASCHKWISAPFGTGLLYVAPRWQHRMKPAIISWGGSVSGQEPSWQDEFNWIGTRDLSGFLAIPEAIRCLEEHGWERFRNETHQLAQYGSERICELTGLEPLIEDHAVWNGSMITLPIPGLVQTGEQHGRRDPLQVALWKNYQIEIPIYTWKKRRFLRISCHTYNTLGDVDHLLNALEESFVTSHESV